MANPRDVVDPETGLLASLNGEYYLNERTGRTHIRVPAGGAGGGVTSYADVPATEEQHVAFLKAQADAKKQESEALAERHGKAHEELKKAQAEEEKEAKEAEARNLGDQRDYRDPNPMAPATQPQPQGQAAPLPNQGVHGVQGMPSGR